MSEHREHGDRGSFLDRIRAHQGPPPAGPHPPPPPPEVVPRIRYRSLDGIGADDLDRLAAVFAEAATDAGATVEVLGTGEPTQPVLDAVVAAHDVRRAVLSRDAEAQALRAPLGAAGVTVTDHDRAAAAEADLGVTSAVAVLAATGSVVLDSTVAGSRAVSLLPRVHLCVVSRARLVPGHAEVLRRPPSPMPSNRLIVTGPSRTADIEQILTTGAHGPVALHVVLTA